VEGEFAKELPGDDAIGRKPQKTFRVTLTPYLREGFDKLMQEQAAIRTEVVPPSDGTGFLLGLYLLVPLLLMAGFWMTLRRARDPLGGTGFLGGFSKSPAKRYAAGDKQVTFADVAGLDQVKADLQEIVGLKDSGGDLETFAGYSKVVREVRPDWSLLIGPEQMLPQAHALGGHGGVCGGANVRPRLFVDLQAALERGDEALAADLQQKVLSLGRLYAVGTQPGRVIVGIKAALACLGICSDVPAAWFEHLDDAQAERIREIVATITG
jgi:hypothetical protein